MDYEQLKEGVAYFESKYPPNNNPWSYKNLRAKGNAYWLHLDALNECELTLEIIDGFLNKWGSRINMSSHSKGWQVSTALREALKNIDPYYGVLQDLKIESVNFRNPIGIGGKQKPIMSVADDIYASFLQVEKIGPTIASKLMHMALPDLFVMLDRGIIDKYCIPKTNLPEIKGKKKSYVAFLILMQENIKHVIESYPDPSRRTTKQVAQVIQHAHDGFSLPRLIDMANFAVRDCEQALCIECMRKARKIWDELGFTPPAWEDDEDDS